jgi:hypothetical protein
MCEEDQHRIWEDADYELHVWGPLARTPVDDRFPWTWQVVSRLDEEKVASGASVTAQEAFDTGVEVLFADAAGELGLTLAQLAHKRELTELKMEQEQGHKPG